MNEQERRIQVLLDLMDDDNEQSASLAMAELLQPEGKEGEDLLNAKLCDLQETSNPRLRRRVHQLQSAIGARYKRKILAAGLRSGRMELLDGVIQLHLSWFDNDLYETVLNDWDDLSDEFRVTNPTSLQDVAAFLLGKGFAAPARDDIEAENYCIGCILDEKIGSDLLLSVIGDLLCRDAGLPFRIIRDGLDFGLSDLHGGKLFPGKNWQLECSSNHDPVQYLRDAQILRIISSLLFLAAAASDGFRYLYTIGNTLAAGFGKKNLDFLPYPYSTAKKPESGK